MTGKPLRISRLVKPVAAVMASRVEIIREVVERLAVELGPVDHSSPVYRFDFSEYYTDEMGPGLVKLFVSFGELRRPCFLAPLKRRTAACERMHHGAGGGRRFNLDPGYWSDAKLVLASTKNYSHRIEIGRRVFAEVTLMAKHHRIEPLPWTYPDYRSPLALEFFSSVRSRYLEQLANLKKG